MNQVIYIKEIVEQGFCPKCRVSVTFEPAENKMICPNCEAKIEFLECPECHHELVDIS